MTRSRARRRFGRMLLGVLALALTTCRDTTGPEPARVFTTPTGLVSAAPPVTFVGAGDIASCSNTGDTQTAALLDTIPGPIFALGDNVYDNGTASEFANCYEPTWGRHKARTYPSAGNHEYNTPGAAPYYEYFGAAAGEPGKGYYSFDLGAWHVIVLDSNIPRSPTSPQIQWLRADLAAHPNRCTLAYWHHPLYSSISGTGSDGATYSSVRTFWDTLYAAGVDLVLNGHRHVYERLAPLRPDGSPDDESGIRTIIAGTGGIGGGTLTDIHPASEVRNGSTRGVLKLYLYEDSYAWRFIPVEGKTFSDTGSTACHGRPGTHGTVSASQSTVVVAPEAITASTGSSASTVTVTAKDGQGRPVAGVSVTLTASGNGNTITQPSAPTGADGVATGTLASTVAGAKTITAVAAGVTLAQQPIVAVGSGPVDSEQSMITAAPGSIPVGSGSSTITVTARDAFGNPVSGAVVTLQASGSGNVLVQPSGTTDAGGQTSGSLSSTVAETKTVSATADGISLGHTASVTVTGPLSSEIEHLLLTADSDPANQKIYTTAPIAPAPNALVTVAVLSHSTFGAPPPPTVTGGGMSSWSEVATVTFDTLLTPRKRLTIFRAMSATPGSGQLTIAHTSNQSSCQWIISQWSGVETAGTNGGEAIVQTRTNRSDAAEGLTVSLDNFESRGNVAYGVFAVNRKNPGISAGDGFSEISEQSSGESPPASLQAQWALDRADISASWTQLRGGALGVEIRRGR